MGDMDDIDAKLRNPDNAKVQIDMPPPAGSLGAIVSAPDMGAAQINAMVEKEGAVGEAANDDPVSTAARRRRVEEVRAAVLKEVSLKRGDKVYDKKHQREAIVREVNEQQKQVRVRYIKNKESHWVNLKHLVKL
jgi:hypothetical protein